MKVEAVIPDVYTGDVIGNISAKRGDIEGMEMHSNGVRSIKVKAPLAEMFGFATSLRSMTQGRGTFTMEFDHYAPVAKEITDQIMVGGR